MHTNRQSLKTLRRIALAHCRSGHPDLAALARELGSIIRQHHVERESGFAELLRARSGLAHWPLRMRGWPLQMKPLQLPPLQMQVIAWPAQHASLLHDHGDRWGLEISLHGALEVETWSRDARGEPQQQTRHWLGPGDALWFDADEPRLHRWRNLSRRDKALSLHVFGGDPVALAYADAAPVSAARPHPTRPILPGLSQPQA